jgi:hypothetical protein
MPAPSMYGRYSPQQQQQQQPLNNNNTNTQQHHQQQPHLIALPIPKNVVLLDMMQAADRQSKEAAQHASNNMDDDDAYNLDAIISGMSTFTGPCGTYAVKQDLCVVATDPRTKQTNADDDVQQQPRVEQQADESSSESPVAPSVSLRVGQTVQVVSLEDGVAKLARGAGYIVATSSQLVKGTYLYLCLFVHMLTLPFLPSTHILPFLFSLLCVQSEDLRNLLAA